MVLGKGSVTTSRHDRALEKSEVSKGNHPQIRLVKYYNLPSDGFSHLSLQSIHRICELILESDQAAPRKMEIDGISGCLDAQVKVLIEAQRVASKMGLPRRLSVGLSRCVLDTPNVCFHFWSHRLSPASALLEAFFDGLYRAEAGRESARQSCLHAALWHRLRCAHYCWLYALFMSSFLRMPPFGRSTYASKVFVASHLWLHVGVSELFVSKCFK